jgi:hypothetical protein
VDAIEATQRRAEGASSNHAVRSGRVIPLGLTDPGEVPQGLGPQPEASPHPRDKSAVYSEERPEAGAVARLGERRTLPPLVRVPMLACIPVTTDGATQALVKLADELLTSCSARSSAVVMAD